MNSNSTKNGQLRVGQPTSVPGGAAAGAGSPRLWLRAGGWVLAAYLVLHIGIASLVNDFEGWANTVGNTMVIAIWGFVLVGLSFGLLVRWGLNPARSGRNRAALAAAGAGIASVLAYAIYFMWAPLVFAPAALLLARAGTGNAADKGRRGYAVVGGILGALSLAYWVFCMVFVLITGTFPLPGPK